MSSQHALSSKFSLSLFVQSDGEWERERVLNKHRINHALFPQSLLTNFFLQLFFLFRFLHVNDVGKVERKQNEIRRDVMAKKWVTTVLGISLLSRTNEWGWWILLSLYAHRNSIGNFLCIFNIITYAFALLIGKNLLCSTTT